MVQLLSLFTAFGCLFYLQVIGGDYTCHFPMSSDQKEIMEQVCHLVENSPQLLKQLVDITHSCHMPANPAAKPSKPAISTTPHSSMIEDADETQMSAPSPVSAQSQGCKPGGLTNHFVDVPTSKWWTVFLQHFRRYIPNKYLDLANGKVAKFVMTAYNLFVTQMGLHRVDSHMQVKKSKKTMIMRMKPTKTSKKDHKGEKHSDGEGGELEFTLQEA